MDPELHKNNQRHHTPPVVIGGVGGSGTRLVAEILLRLGYFLGTDLNNANDNLWATLLFKRREILHTTYTEFAELVEVMSLGMLGGRQFTRDQTSLILRLADQDRLQHPKEWLQERARSLLSVRPQSVSPIHLWGWKEPNMHMVLDQLAESITGLKFILVVRNGLDMAYSSNQNQLHFWGKVVIGEDIPYTPRNALRFWCTAHQRTLRAATSLGANFFFLNFNQLCQNPNESIRQLNDFLGSQITGSLPDLVSLVDPQAASNRYQPHGLDQFDPQDVEYVRSLGFMVDL